MEKQTINVKNNWSEAFRQYAEIFKDDKQLLPDYLDAEADELL